MAAANSIFAQSCPCAEVSPVQWNSIELDSRMKGFMPKQCVFLQHGNLTHCSNMFACQDSIWNQALTHVLILVAGHCTHLHALFEKQTWPWIRLKVSPLPLEIRDGEPVYRDIRFNQTHLCCLLDSFGMSRFLWPHSLLTLVQWQVVLPEHKQCHGHVWIPR
jgi:hypothetical protein